MTLRGLWNWWYDVWFAPKPVTPIALYRILLGLLILQFGILMWPNLSTFFGEKGIVSYQTAMEFAHGPQLNAFTLLPRDDHSLTVAFFVFMVAALFLTLGLLTRLSSVIVFFGLVSLCFRDPFVLNSGDCLMRIGAFLLMLSPCGEAFSLDNLIKVALARDPTAVAFPHRSPWAQRLLQFNLAAVYADAFWTKITSHQWLDGLAVYYATRLEQFKRFPVPFLFDYLWTCKLATWATLAVELAMWTLIWFRDIRYWVMALALLFHLGLDWTLNIPQFQLVMISTMILFVDPADLTRIMDAIKSRVSRLAGGSIRLAFDASSTAGLRAAEIIRRLDVFGLVELVDSATLEGTEDPGLKASHRLVAVRKGDGWLHGLDALRCLCGRLPLLWILYPLLILPGTALLASRLQKRSDHVAESL